MIRLLIAVEFLLNKCFIYVHTLFVLHGFNKFLYASYYGSGEILYIIMLEHSAIEFFF